MKANLNKKRVYASVSRGRKGNAKGAKLGGPEPLSAVTEKSNEHDGAK